jgi:protein-S-isoprenylcysteine O-methyltransferase Ste14
MGDRSTKATQKAALGLAELVLLIALLLFGPAGTIRYVEGWTFLLLFSGASVSITIYLARRDPALLARRTQAGPVAERQTLQKVIQSLASIAFVSMMVIPALDRRFGWSRAPLPLVIAGDVFVLTGFLIVFLVFKENTFTSAVIEVADTQRVIETGPYAVVRHPMYLGALILLAGVPPALGSVVGLVTFVPFVGIIVWRLLEEERYLETHLTGYAAYRERTRYRLIPYVW